MGVRGDMRIYITNFRSRSRVRGYDIIALILVEKNTGNNGSWGDPGPGTSAAASRVQGQAQQGQES